MDTSFLPKTRDTPGISFTWNQSCEIGDPSVGIQFFLHDVPAAAQAKEFDVKVKDDDIIYVGHKGTTVVQWRLYSSLEPSDGPLDWQLNRNTKPLSLEINMRKKEDHMWLSLRKQPVIAAEKPDELFVTEDKLQEFVEVEVPVLPPYAPPADESAAGETAAAAADSEEQKKDDAVEADSETEEKKKEGGEEAEEKADGGDKDKAPEDLDALLDDVAEEALEKKDDKKDGESAAGASAAAVDDDDIDALPGDAALTPANVNKVKAKREISQYEHEMKTLESTIKELEEKLAKEGPEALEEKERADAESTLKIAKAMKEIGVEKRIIRSQHVSLANLITVQKLEIKKTLVNARVENGDDVEEEQPGDAGKSGQQLYRAAMEILKSGASETDGEAAVHLLRLAAIKHNHPTSALVLLKVYLQRRMPTRGASLVLRRALMDGDDLEPLTNRQVAQLIDNGAHPFPAIFALAIHFFQRAARIGDAQAMLGLAQSFFNGACASQRQLLHPEVRKKFADEERGRAFMRAAIDRGSPEAYLMTAIFHLHGERGHEKSLPLAKKWLDLAKKTHAEMAASAKSMFDQAEAELSGATRVNNLVSGGGAGAGARGPAALGGGGGRPVPGGAGQLATRPGAAGGGGAGSSRLDALSARSGGDAGGAGFGGGGGGAGGFGRSMGGGGGGGATNPWQTRMESVARFGAAAYFLYIAAFPARLMVMPWFYSVLGDIIGRFTGGGGGSDRGSRMRGGMLM